MHYPSAFIRNFLVTTLKPNGVQVATKEENTSNRSYITFVTM